MKHHPIPARRLDFDVRSRRLRASTNKLHHEAELVAAIERRGVNIPAAEALDRVFGYTFRFCIDLAWDDAYCTLVDFRMISGHGLPMRCVGAA